MPTTIDEHYIDTVWGAKLRCLSAGDGPNTIVLIPGITMTADVFTHQMERFASRTVRVVSYDTRGQGDSTKGWDHHDYDTRAEDVNKVIQTIAGGPVVVGSRSQGLFEHLAFIRRHGVDRSATSIIIDSAPRQMCEDPTKEWGWLQAGWLNPSSPLDSHIETWILGPTVDRAGFNNHLITWIFEDPNPRGTRVLRGDVCQDAGRDRIAAECHGDSPRLPGGAQGSRAQPAHSDHRPRGLGGGGWPVGLEERAASHLQHDAQARHFLGASRIVQRACCALSEWLSALGRLSRPGMGRPGGAQQTDVSRIGSTLRRTR